MAIPFDRTYKPGTQKGVLPRKARKPAIAWPARETEAVHAGVIAMHCDDSGRAEQGLVFLAPSPGLLD